MDTELKANIMTISRHRIGSDGGGVRALVTFYGCPLHCKYCINDFCHDSVSNTKTTDEVLAELMKDDLYFKATDGGVTFGGGEPLLQSSFIKELIEKMPKQWNVCVETSLAVDYRHMLELVRYVDHWFVDTKDFRNERIYNEYTQTKGLHPLMVRNLIYLKDIVGEKKITVRIPCIKGFNNETDVNLSESFLKLNGFTNIDKFDYEITNE